MQEIIDANVMSSNKQKNVTSSSSLENPVVSVCITTYNHEPFIAQALDSVLAQETDFDYEILLGEDDSSDSTRAICIEYAEKYPDKIKLFLNDRKNVIYINGMATGRWNFINNLKNARAKYIALLEGDDYWTAKEKLQNQINFLEKNEEYAICFHNAYVINTINSPQGEVSEYQEFKWCGLDRNIHEYSTSDLISSPLCPTASVVFRRPKKFIIPDWFYKVPSADMALETIVCGKSKIKYLDNFWSVYRKHPGGISNTHKGDFIHVGRIFMYLSLLEFFNGNFKSEIKKVVKSHLNEIETYRNFSYIEKKSLMKLVPLFMLKKKISSVLGLK